MTNRFAPRLVFQMYYNDYVDKTVTIRIPAAQDKALRARARARRTTRSEIIREFIGQGLARSALGRRIGHLKGALESVAPAGGWPRHIKDHNWR